MADEFLTQKGLKELEDRLELLKSVKRREVAEKIKVAREFGDISENAEYDAAKEEQAMIEGEIVEIENKLKLAKVIDENDIDTSAVSVGCSVRILDVEFKEELEYQIVGTTESDFLNGKISNESPVGHALLGKRVGEFADAKTPDGVVRFKVLAIKN